MRKPAELSAAITAAVPDLQRAIPRNSTSPSRKAAWWPPARRHCRSSTSTRCAVFHIAAYGRFDLDAAADYQDVDHAQTPCRQESWLGRDTAFLWLQESGPDSIRSPEGCSALVRHWGYHES